MYALKERFTQKSKFSQSSHSHVDGKSGEVLFHSKIAFSYTTEVDGENKWLHAAHRA